jgi:hypothetical protein
VSRSTVGEYLRRAAVIGITWPAPEGLDDAELERRLLTHVCRDRSAGAQSPSGDALSVCQCPAKVIAALKEFAQKTSENVSPN